MAPRGTTVLGVCVNIGSMLAPSFRGFLATNLLTRGVLMRHEDASADPRMLVKGWIAQSVTLRGLTRNFRVPGGRLPIVVVHRLTGTGRAPDPLDRCLQFRLSPHSSRPA
jgi:hypothetical protein